MCVMGQVSDNKASITANAVLSAYLDNKAKLEYKEDRNKCVEFLRQTGYRPVSLGKEGGTITVKHPFFSESDRETIRRLFDTRHSCRVFSEQHISDEDINEAVKMALRCPSACNRQPFHVYVIEPSKLAERMGRDSLQYNGDRTLIITGDIRAYTSSEMLDWIVSPSIFVGYLTLSLHSLGIGSCVVRKELFNNHPYNDAVRALTGMDESEQVILELFIGYYKNETIVPISNRLQVKDIITTV